MVDPLVHQAAQHSRNDTPAGGPHLWLTCCTTLLDRLCVSLMAIRTSSTLRACTLARRACVLGSSAGAAETSLAAGCSLAPAAQGKTL